MMTNIWVNRLIDGDKWTWEDVPENRKKAIKEELKRRVNNEYITAERYFEITGETYEG